MGGASGAPNHSDRPHHGTIARPHELAADGQRLDLALVRIEDPDSSVGNGTGAVPDVPISADIDLGHITSPWCRIIGEFFRLGVEPDDGTRLSPIADPDQVGVGM